MTTTTCRTWFWGSESSSPEQTEKYAPPENPALPPSDMTLDLAWTGRLITDPQIDFPSPKGATWALVGESVTEQNTVPNIERLMVAAIEASIQVFVSPHYYFPTDKGQQFEGAREEEMHTIGMFDRSGALSLEGFENSSAQNRVPSERRKVIRVLSSTVTDDVTAIRSESDRALELGSCTMPRRP